MTTPQQTALQLAARKLIRAQESTALLGRFLGSDHPKLADIAACIQDDLNDLGGALEAAGATYQPTDKPGASASFQAPATDPHGLEALRRVEESRKEAEDLVDILLYAQPIAEALDKARGNWVGDMAHTDRGETPGTDYAEAVQALILRLQGELGATGGGRE